jgi:hypothetical protein
VGAKQKPKPETKPDLVYIRRQCSKKFVTLNPMLLRRALQQLWDGKSRFFVIWDFSNLCTKIFALPHLQCVLFISSFKLYVAGCFLTRGVEKIERFLANLALFKPLIHPLHHIKLCSVTTLPVEQRNRYYS